MITWKKDSDLFFKVYLTDKDTGLVLDPLEKSFDIIAYTTIKGCGAHASYSKLDEKFVNCSIDSEDPFKVNLFFAKPNLKLGRLRLEVRFRDPNAEYDDGYFDVWTELITNIEIVK